MNSLPIQTTQTESGLSLARIARFARLRALAWSKDVLYASRGYELLCARIQSPPANINWQNVASFHPELKRRLSVTNRLTSRLLRDGFHALAVLPDGGLVGAVPGAIITLSRGESKFRTTHTITRGTRPLHITAVPEGSVFWGEYFDNASRDEVHIYGSRDGGSTWDVAYTFPKGAIRHVHNVLYDRWQHCLWILTGDYGDECRVLRTSCDFKSVELVMQGRQQARAVAAIPTPDALYFATDTPLESNFIYRLDRGGNLTQVAPISSSSIYGCQADGRLFFSTMVEPSEINRDPRVRIYGGDAEANDWKSLLEWKKDRWSMRFFQYGNAFLPDGDNCTSCLAVSTIAVNADDMVTSLYSVEPCRCTLEIP